MFHQGIDPTHGVRRTARSVFGPKDQIEAVPRIRKSTLPDESADRGSKVLRGEVERVQRLFPREVGAALRKLLVQVFVEGGHAQSYAKLDNSAMFLHMIRAGNARRVGGERYIYHSPPAQRDNDSWPSRKRKQRG